MTRLAAALLAVLVLGGCTGSDDPEAAPTPPAATTPSPTSTPTSAQAAPRPEGRACYRLTYPDAVAPTSTVPPSSCSRDHTSLTFFVGELDTLVDGHLLAVDSDRVQRQVARECPRRLGSFVGGTLEQRRLSMLRAVWFTPTVEESDAGANWFRCDVTAVAGEKELAPLTGRLSGTLGTPAGRSRYAMCGTAEPGSVGFRRVICSRADQAQWRALRTVTFRPGDYPGEQRVRSAGEGPCEDAGRAAADDPLDFRWGYEWPRPEQWGNGQTYGICWAPD